MIIYILPSLERILQVTHHTIYQIKEVINISSSAKNKEARETAIKRLRGKPRRWLTEESLIEDFVHYLEYCSQQEPKRIPNIAGFCVYSDIIRETFYMQGEYYPYAFEKIKLSLEDQTMNIKDTIRSIFLLKANFGYRDSDPAAGLITVNYNNVSEGQLESWLRDSGLKLSEPNEDD